MQKILLASLVSAAFAMPAVAAEQADVVIIGSGGAGLSAAVTAHDLGKKVIVLEKMAMVGGNTNRAAGGLNAAETKPQAKLGIKDSIESHFNDTIKGGHYSAFLASGLVGHAGGEQLVRETLKNINKLFAE